MLSLTLQEFTKFSDVDFQGATTCHVSVVWFYPGKKGSHEEEDPAMVIKALSIVLVSYYPFTGRIRRSDRGKKTCPGVQ